jgi:SAM-dependent methyltransferase
VTAEGAPFQFPEQFFRRLDPSPDRFFYDTPRFVNHIDDATIAALTALYAEMIPPGSRVLDLMSSWVSHLPADREYARVTGLGMNAEELKANGQLTEWTVQDLNERPTLPYEDASFDVATCAVSVQYLTRPLEVFREVGRVLSPGGVFAVSFSHRTFPEKAIEAWRTMPAADLVRLVAAYFAISGPFGEPIFLDRSPEGADPLWCVVGRRE